MQQHNATKNLCARLRHNNAREQERRRRCIYIYTHICMYVFAAGSERGRTEKTRAVVVDRREKRKGGEGRGGALRPRFAYRRLCVTLLSVCRGVNRSVPLQVLQHCVLAGHVRPPSGFAPGAPRPPARPTQPHPLSCHTPGTDSSADQDNVGRFSCLLKTPGCPSPRRESKGLLRDPERANEAAERKREQHRPSPTSLLPVLLAAR